MNTSKSLKDFCSILEKLLEYYESNYKELERLDSIEVDKDYFISFISEKSIDLGLCHCASRVFNENIYISLFIRNFCKGHLSLCETPLEILVKYGNSSRRDLMIPIKKRIVRIKEFLNEKNESFY